MSDAPLSTTDAHEYVAAPAAGASVTFTGVVRDHATSDQAQGDGSGVARAVTGLDYEAYGKVALARLNELTAATGERWPDLCAGYVVHRVGSLAVGDIAVIVAVSSPHRDTAFDAGRHLIDAVKEHVPIWKKEHWADGGHHWPGTD